MDPYSGQTYTDAEAERLDAQSRGRLVRVEGDAAHIDRLATAARHYSDVTGPNRAKRRAAQKAARKARRHNRT
jgi:hypothetical protein